MRSIRKFVRGVRVAAGLGAVLALALSVPTAAAHVVGGTPTDRPETPAATTDLTSLSSECVTALQALRDALVADRQEDADEAHNPNPSGDAAEDAAEVSQFTPVISSLRTACAAQIASVTTRPPIATQPSVPAQCTAAVQAWKAFAGTLWAQHTAPTAAQLAQLRQLGAAVRTTCGWSTGDWPARVR